MSIETFVETDAHLFSGLTEQMSDTHQQLVKSRCFFCFVFVRWIIELGIGIKSETL